MHINGGYIAILCTEQVICKKQSYCIASMSIIGRAYTSMTSSCRLRTGRTDSRPSAAAAVVPGVASQAAAVATRSRRRSDRAAAADHHRADHRQRHVRHQTQSAVQGHVLRTQVCHHDACALMF